MVLTLDVQNNATRAMFLLCSAVRYWLRAIETLVDVPGSNGSFGRFAYGERSRVTQRLIAHRSYTGLNVADFAHIAPKTTRGPALTETGPNLRRTAQKPAKFGSNVDEYYFTPHRGHSQMRVIGLS
jgi:hypothetical protein